MEVEAIGGFYPVFRFQCRYLTVLENTLVACYTNPKAEG